MVSETCRPKGSDGWVYLITVVLTTNHNYMELLPKNANDLAETLGIAVLLFFSISIFATVMIIYMRGENKKWEEREVNTANVYHTIIEQITLSRNEDMKLLTAALDDNREQISINRGLVERIKAMQLAHEVAMRDIFDKLSRILEDRCRHHININKDNKDHK